MKLNQQQEEAANHVDGPCLVIAVPGSGKTHLLVERTARLVEIHKISPKNIVCVTFTNKAAEEMNARLCKRLSVTKLDIFVGTFHRLCATLLRKFGHHVNVRRNFTILDSDEQLDVIRQIARQEGRKLEKAEAQEIAKTINNWRETLSSRDDLEDALGGNDFKILVTDRYFERLEQDNVIDFSGLLYKAIELLDNNPKVLEKVQEQTQYLQVDECQDTNFAQFYFINLISAKWNNVFCVGDLSQCVMGDTVVQTPQGDKLMRDVSVGDLVKCAAGSGRTEFGRVTAVYERQLIMSRIIKVRTKSGKVLCSTPEHVYFAGFTPSTSSKHFVYLMYKDRLGYRIGTSRAYQGNCNQGRMGYEMRSCGEAADKTWVVRVCKTEVEARFYEQLYSVTCGIPIWTFRPHTKGENSPDQGWIDALFQQSNSVAGGKRLLEKLGFDERYPHHVPKAMAMSRRRNFVVTLCADNRVKSLHSYAVSGSEADDAATLNSIGLKVRPAKRGVKGWRVESSVANLSQIKQLYDRVAGEMDVNLVEQARFTSRSLPFMPASNLLAGMTLFVEQNGNIVEDEIESIESSYEEATVYDIDVDRYHNFVGNGIVTHNSIYRFRGARYQNIQDFVRKNQNCRIIELPLNYRSTPQIVKAADVLIRHNKSHMAESFIANNPDGEHVRCLPFNDQTREAEFVAKQISKLIRDGGWSPSDVAILYRLNSMSEPIERALTNERIDYTVIGGRSFYDRREIRDVLAMLRFMSNPHDGVAFHRVASLLSGLGDVTIGKIETAARAANTTILEACKSFASASRSQAVRESCEKIAKVFAYDFSEKTPAEAMNHAVERLAYHQYLLDSYKDDGEDRVQNVRSLLDSAAAFGTDLGNTAIEKYLQMVALITSSDKDAERNCVSLMTIHASKGLEFPIVFLIGVEHNILPHAMAIAEDPVEGVEEERRLCYVGMTRAERLLYMTYCRNRATFQKGNGVYYKKTKPSQFLFECNLLKSEQKAIA